MKSIKENLLVQFSVVSFVVIAALGLGFATALSTKIQSDAINALVSEAVDVASPRLAKELKPSDLKGPMTRQRYDTFHEFVERSILSKQTARVKVRARDGTIVYADDPQLVGKKPPVNDPLIRALRGETVKILRVPQDAAHASETHLGRLMEVVTPIRFEGASTEPTGVFALYQYYEPTARRIDAMRRWVFASIAMGFTILYLSLVSIVWRAWRRVRDRTLRLESANKSLENEVSERRRAEEVLAHRSQELSRSNRELEEFANVASHDLQEPLRKVQAFGDLLAAESGDALNDDGRDYLERMQGAAGRMQVLIRDLLRFSRITTGAEPFVSVDMSELTQEVLSDMEVTIAESGARVEVGRLPVIEADPTQMRQLVQNLISNGLKFHRPGEPPFVKISGRSSSNGRNGLSNGSPGAGDICEITVEDNGVGFDEQYIDRIFTIFQRLHSRGQYEGSGIGLAVCRKIVERHDGSISASSTPGEGATFSVRLPMSQANGGGEQ